MRLILVHSPYLGPSSWEPTANQLRTFGYDVAVPDLRGRLNRQPFALSFIAAIRDTVDPLTGGPNVLIGHSRSGPLLPAAANGGRSVAALLYVDAALPYPGRSWADQAPPEQLTTLKGKAVAGLLPRWSDWWDDHSVIERLVTDAKLRVQLVDEMPQVPSSFLDERLPDVDWRGKAGYLQLSAAYAAYADASQDAGWPVEERALDHLAILTAPAEVASAIVRLLNAVMPTGA